MRRGEGERDRREEKLLKLEVCVVRGISGGVLRNSYTGFLSNAA